MAAKPSHRKEKFKRLVAKHDRNWLVFKNDSDEQARVLCDWVRDLPFPCLINLISYNSTGGEFQRPDRNQVAKFKSIVERSGQKVTVRITLGHDIDADCGQLPNKATQAI